MTTIIISAVSFAVGVLGTILIVKILSKKVIVKTWEEMLKIGELELDSDSGEQIVINDNFEAFVDSMKKYCGKTVTIKKELKNYPIKTYIIKEDNGEWVFQDWMFN